MRSALNQYPIQLRSEPSFLNTSIPFKPRAPLTLIRWEAQMLILMRRLGEIITIGEDIEISILEIRRHRVRIGVSAPKELSVYRKEVYERIKKERSLHPVDLAQYPEKKPK